jgi:hypothetical protein
MRWRSEAIIYKKEPIVNGTANFLLAKMPFLVIVTGRVSSVCIEAMAPSRLTAIPGRSV